MKIFLALFFMVSFCSLTLAQYVKGKVIDKNTNLPIENVNVYVDQQRDGTFTNVNGEFDLKLKKRIKLDNYVYFTHVSYGSQKLNFKKLKKQNFIVELKIDTNKLDEVNLLSRRKLRQQLKYESLPSMNKGTYAFGSVLADDKIYVFGGDQTVGINAIKKAINDNPSLTSSSLSRLLIESSMASLGSYEGYNNSLQVFNLKKDEWTIEKTKLQKRAYHDMIYDKENEEIYVVGGRRLSMHRKFEYLTNEIEIFDLKKDTVLTDKTNPHQAVNFTSFIKDDNIILLGGSIKQKRNNKKVFTDKVHLFDIKKGLWYDLGNMPEAKETSGVLFNNKIYLIGGYDGKALSSIETFDLNNGKWNKIGELFKPVARPGIASDKEYIYIYYPGNLAIYNVKTDIINEYVINFYVNEPQVHFSNYKLYLLGGYDENEYQKEPSSKMISIDLNELKYTHIKRSKKVGDTI